MVFSLFKTIYSLQKENIAINDSFIYDSLLIMDKMDQNTAMNLGGSLAELTFIAIGLLVGYQFYKMWKKKKKKSS